MKLQKEKTQKKGLATLLSLRIEYISLSEQAFIRVTMKEKEFAENGFIKGWRCDREMEEEANERDIYI